MDWKKIHLVDGWKIRRDDSGYTLTASVYAEKMDDLPTRGNTVPTGNLGCAVPNQFKSYLVTEVEITPLTSVGPWLADVTAKAHLSASGKMSDSLLSQNSVSAGFQDFLVKPWYCAVRDRGESDEWSPVGDRFVSLFEDDKSGSKWNGNLKRIIPGCPFKNRPHIKHAGETIRFLAVTVKFNRLEGNGIEDWANFHGIVPVSSMPSWIKIPHGDNRWRLWDETYEMGKDTNGKRILSVTRVFLGIPSGFVEQEGGRCQWNQSLLGQKNWGDLA